MFQPQLFFSINKECNSSYMKETFDREILFNMFSAYKLFVDLKEKTWCKYGQQITRLRLFL